MLLVEKFIHVLSQIDSVPLRVWLCPKHVPFFVFQVVSDSETTSVSAGVWAGLCSETCVLITATQRVPKQQTYMFFLFIRCDLIELQGIQRTRRELA